MRLKDYLCINDMTANEFAKLCGINVQTLYSMMRGKNCGSYNLAKVLHATNGEVDFWSFIPDDLKESFAKDVKQLDSKKNQLKLPSNEELKEMSMQIKARNHSKFSGMCC